MPHRILIVEDEGIIALDLQDMLNEAGFETVGIARDMHMALHFAENREIDLVTMDVRLASGTDGVETALKLWDRHGLRSLFVSASLDPAMRERAAPAHPVGFVSKPVISGEIVRALSGHFQEGEQRVLAYGRR